jgi:hypothetical protein
MKIIITDVPPRNCCMQNIKIFCKYACIFHVNSALLENSSGI